MREPGGGVGAAIGVSTLVLIGLTLAAKILGFVEKQVIAYYFGAGTGVDAFFVALSVPMVIFLFVRELVEPAYLPLFVGQLDAGRRDRAWKLLAAVAAGIAALTVPAAALGWLGAEPLAARLAPGFDAETRALAASLIRWTAPGGVFLGLSALTYITLNGYRRFALPASGELVFKAAPIAAAVALASQVGVTALALGVLVGCAGRLLVHVGGLARELSWLRWPTAESREDLRHLGLLMAPLAIGVAFSQVSELADNFFSSQVGSGGVAAKTFARKIVDLPILLLPYALSVVVFPWFSSLASRGEWDRLYDMLGRGLRGLALLFSYLAVATVLLAEPVVTLLLERGAFDASAREMTTWPLRLYGAGLVTFALEALLVPFYFALRDTRTPIAVGIAGVLVNIALTAALIGPFGVGGVALALTVSKTLKVAVLAALLRRKRDGLRFGPVAASASRLLVAAGLAGAGIHGVTLLLGVPGPTASLLAQVGFLAAAAGTGFFLFAGFALLLPSPERTLLRETWQWALHLRSRRVDSTAR